MRSRLTAATVRITLSRRRNASTRSGSAGRIATSRAAQGRVGRWRISRWTGCSTARSRPVSRRGTRVTAKRRRRVNATPSPGARARSRCEGCPQARWCTPASTSTCGQSGVLAEAARPCGVGRHGLARSQRTAGTSRAAGDAGPARGAHGRRVLRPGVGAGCGDRPCATGRVGRRWRTNFDRRPFAVPGDRDVRTGAARRQMAACCRPENSRSRQAIGLGVERRTFASLGNTSAFPRRTPASIYPQDSAVPATGKAAAGRAAGAAETARSRPGRKSRNSSCYATC